MYLKLSVCIASILLLSLSNRAQEYFNEADTFPVPPARKDMMFYLQRTTNSNTIVYALNYKEAGYLNETSPVKVYWIRYTEKGHPIKGLNEIQRRFAYGIKSKKSGKDTWDLRMVAYDKLPLILKRGKDHVYYVFVNIKGKEYVFTKAYIKVDGGSFWMPNIPYIDIYVKDDLNRKIIHRIHNP
jgi:hypothetical protein